jgi:hypothetical protein
MASSPKLSNPIARIKRLLMLAMGSCCIVLSGPIAASPCYLLAKYFFTAKDCYPDMWMIGWPIIILGLGLVSVGIRRPRSELAREAGFIKRMVSELRFFPIVTLAFGLVILSFFFIRGVWFPPIDETIVSEIHNATEQERPKIEVSGITVMSPDSPYWESFDYLFGLPLGGPVYGDNSQLSQNALTAEFPLASPRRRFSYQHHSWDSISAEIVRGQQTVRITFDLTRGGGCEVTVGVKEESKLSRCDGVKSPKVRCCTTRYWTHHGDKFIGKFIFDFATLP